MIFEPEAQKELLAAARSGFRAIGVVALDSPTGRVGVLTKIEGTVADMGIDAVLRAENREDLASVLDARMLLARAAASGKFCQTHLLKYLVPWGDAVFNQAQAQDLRDDIRLLANANPGSPLSQQLVAIDALVERLSQETHSYLWFIGD